MKKLFAPALALVALIGVSSTGLAGVSILPDNSKTAGEAVKTMKEAGHTGIASIKFEEGKWVVKAYEGNQKTKLTLDPTSLKVMDQSNKKTDVKIPDNVISAAEAIAIAKENALVNIFDVVYLADENMWEVQGLDGRMIDIIDIKAENGEVGRFFSKPAE